MIFRPLRRLFMSLGFWGAAAAVGGGAFEPVTYVYTTPGSSSVPVPSGATQLIVETWGAGGGGQGATDNGWVSSQGGGGGGYSKRVVVLLAGDAGKSIAYTVGAGGTKGAASGGAGGKGATGGTTSCSGSTLAYSFSQSCNGGKGGEQETTSIFSAWVGGQGGTATGGTTNTTGNSSSTVNTNSFGAAALVGDLSESAGKGGDGYRYVSYHSTVAPQNGAVGKVKLRFS